MIVDLEGARQISCGDDHFAIVTSDGRVSSVGLAVRTKTLTARRGVKDHILDRNWIQQVSCGRDHIAYVDRRGRVRVLGNNDRGQLGREKGSAFTIQPIEGFESIKQVDCGNNHTAFIDSQGRVWTFGYGGRVNSDTETVKIYRNLQ